MNRKKEFKNLTDSGNIITSAKMKRCENDLHRIAFAN